MEPTGPGQGPTPGMQYDLPARQKKIVQPMQHVQNQEGTQPAIDLIRQKLNQIYGQEPDAREEKQEAEAVTVRSKHQQFMHELSQSGRSLAEIQTAWHNYYVNLPDEEKHEVWHEFYANHQQFAPELAKATHIPKPEPLGITPDKPKKLQGKDLEAAIATVPEKVLDQPDVALPEPKQKHLGHSKPKRVAKRNRQDPRTVTDIKDQLLTKVSQRAKRHSKVHAHVQSLMFGLASGLIVLTVLLFSFFNERFLAPFMTPSRAISNTPIIIDPNNSSAGPESKIIIPKINVDIPVVYDVKSIKEDAVQAGLERGVVHYATTPNPGELGNGVVFGHSANNILNKGEYKFAFVLLRKLEPGDLFYLQKNSKLYVYKVYEKKVVPPTDISVLNTKDKPATFTLITCDPPGTNLNRLVVVGEQISPDPGTGVPSTATSQGTADKPAQLPSNSPSLWDRFWGSLSN
jgi:LPXTG-site transpeptidase (sortase) family protein